MLKLPYVPLYTKDMGKFHTTFWYLGHSCPCVESFAFFSHPLSKINKLTVKLHKIPEAFSPLQAPSSKKNKKKRSRGGWWTLLNFTVWVLPKKWWINTQCVPNCTKRLIDSCFESLEKKGHISKLRLKRVGEIFSALLSNSCFPVKLEAGRTQNLWNLLQLEIASSFPL